MGTNRNQSRPRSNRGGYGWVYSHNTTQFRKCRACQSLVHFITECPSPYCQACGNKGHDTWSSTCQNYNQWLYDTEKTDETWGDKFSAILNLRFGNKDVNAWIDTGATCSLIEIASLQKLGLHTNFKKSKPMLIDASGNNMNISDIDIQIFNTTNKAVLYWELCLLLMLQMSSMYFSFDKVCF